MVERFFQLEGYAWLLVLFSQRRHLIEKQKFLQRLERRGVMVRQDCLIDAHTHVVVQRHDS